MCIESYQETFDNLKEFLSSPPLLSRQKLGEILYLYLVATKETIALVLIREEEIEQYLVYYISKALQGAETRYPQIKKLAFTLFMSVKKLRQYFEAHQMIV